MTPAEFKKEVVKILPGYSWTFHRSSAPEIYLDATGIQSSGSNRLSTVYVIRREKKGVVEYEVKSAGYGRRAPWLSVAHRRTLAQALRQLQDHYEYSASNYSAHARCLENARKKKMA